VITRRRRASASREAGDEEHHFEPIAIVEVELSAPLAPIHAIDDQGTRYGRAWMVVRLHSKPLGVVDVSLADEDGSAPACAAAIWAALGAEINAHLRSDGLPEVRGLDERGLRPTASPRCLARRTDVLRDAPFTSVIICTRNRPETLGRTLRSLERLDYPSYEILVIDGSPSQETADLVREGFPEVRYFHVGDHGRSVALNLATNQARGAIAAFTDDDVRVDRHWLAELVAGFGLDERIASVTGIAFPMELQTPAQVWFEESGAFTSGFKPRLIGLDVTPEPGSLLPYATGKIGAGVNMAWRTEVLRELGGFDITLDTLRPPWPPGAGHGSSAEDLAAFFDALTRGYRLAFEPGAVVFHEHRRTYEELSRQIYWHGIGLSGYLTRCLLNRPSQIPGFLRRVPRGLEYGFGISSVRNVQKSADFPRELTHAEWRGILLGPVAYLRGLPLARRVHHTQPAAARPPELAAVHAPQKPGSSPTRSRSAP
jgi:glycosyltransferase involved in cell wall biosynthesis